MPQDQLKLRIGADIKEAVAGVKIFQDTVEDFAKATVTASNQAGAAINDLQRKFKAFGGLRPFTPPIKPIPASVPESFRGITTTAGKATDALGKAAESAKKSTTNFTGLSRVVQDLPFGFVAISNNLTQLLPAAGAVGVAISAVTAALTFASVGFGAWTRGFEDSSEKARKAADVLKQYVDALEDVDKARVLGAQNAQEELVSLQTLYKATQNVNIPLAQRKKLVDELQEQYPKYFANIKDEVILAGGAEAAYKKLSTAILQTARARAAQDILVDIQKNLLAVEEKQTDNEKQRLKELKAYDNYRKKIQAEDAGFNPKGIAAVDTRSVQKQTELTKQQGKYNNLVQEGVSLVNQRNTLLDRANKITSEIAATVEANPDVLLDPGGNLPKQVKEKLEKALKVTYDISPDVLLVPEFQVDTKKLQEIFIDTEIGLKSVELPVNFNIGDANKALLLDKYKKLFEEVGKKLPEEVQIGEGSVAISTINGPASLALLEKALQDLLAKAKTPIEKLKTGLQSAVSSSFTNIFSGIGESLGAALASGMNPLEAVGKSIFSTIGDLISQMGKALIEYGVVKEGLDKILAGGIVIPGVAAIVAGVAAVAVGALIKNAFKPKGFATGGWVTGGQAGKDSVPIMAMPGEFVLSKSMVNQLRRGDFSVISENFNTPLNSFKSSDARTIRGANRIEGGGAVDVHITGQFVQQGTALVAAISQVQQSQRRNR